MSNTDIEGINGFIRYGIFKFWKIAYLEYKSKLKILVVII